MQKLITPNNYFEITKNRLVNQQVVYFYGKYEKWVMEIRINYILSIAFTFYAVYIIISYILHILYK
jgi:hypothetical protein